MTCTPIGIDIAKDKFDVAVLLDNGKYKTKVFRNTPKGFSAFSGWLEFCTEPHLCMEATGVYGEALAIFLADQGLCVSVVNPARIAAFSKAELSRTKTDRGDAKLIARFCSQQQPAAWEPPPRSLRELQALVRRLDSLLEMRQMEANRREVADPAVIESIEQLLVSLDEQITATRQKIRDHIDDDPDLRQRRDLLDSIPGLGRESIPQLLAAIGNPQRFTSAKQLAAFAGLCPVLRESGNWKGRSRLSKTGDRQLRKALYMPAMVAWRYNPAIRGFCERLRARGKNGKLILGAACASCCASLSPSSNRVSRSTLIGGLWKLKQDGIYAGRVLTSARHIPAFFVC